MMDQPDLEPGLIPWARPPGWAVRYRPTTSRFTTKTRRIAPSTALTRRCRRLLKMVVLLSLFLYVSLALSARMRPVNGTAPSNGAPAGPDTVFREESDSSSSSSSSSTSSSTSTTTSSDNSWPTASASPPASVSPFPYAHGTDLKTHDPTILKVNNTYYSYSVGPSIIVKEASSLDGPWTETGSVLRGSSAVKKGDRKAPWAPNIVPLDGKFYCYYSVSNSGCRDSAIGVASSDSPGAGGWEDHGLMIQSGTGEGSEIFPLNQSNAIDPNIFLDSDGSVYMQFGSFWTGLWQVTLNKDYLTVQGADSGNIETSHLAAEPNKIWRSRKASKSKNKSPICGDPSGGHPIEGAYLAFHEPYYYLWYSWGRCCEFQNEKMRTNGQEYRIRVGRSQSVHGPFVDRSGIDLVNGGGETVYGSNADVFAPGGQGILTDDEGDILYYHYCEFPAHQQHLEQQLTKTVNTSVSYDFNSARLGYNRLEYVDGWPVAVY